MIRRLADQPVRAREERHEEQGANQDRHDVDRNLRVADAPHIHKAVWVLVREGASHKRVRHPRDRDQQGAPQRRPRDAAARSRERGRAHEGGGDDDVLERVGDEGVAGEDLVGADEGRVDDRGHGDHHERAQVRGPAPRSYAASAREEGRDDRNHDVGQLGEVGQAIDEALGRARPAVGGAREEALLDVGRRSIAIKGRNDEGGGNARPGEGGDHPVGGAPATAQFSHVSCHRSPQTPPPQSDSALQRDAQQ